MNDEHDKHRAHASPRRTRRSLLVAITIGIGVPVTLLIVRPEVFDAFGPGEEPQPPRQFPGRAFAVRSPFASTAEIGRSAQGRPILVVRVGMGTRMVVVAGAIHGAEGNTARMVEALAIRAADEAESLPRDFSLFFVPSLNPDGLAARTRYNAHAVDLNRNWNTNNWRSNLTESPDDPPSAGGPVPFSEPETAAFSSWLLGLRRQCVGRLCVILYHSARPPKGLVQPGYRIVVGRQETDPNAAAMGRYWSERLAYEYSPTWPDYSITGEAIHWCAENGIPCIDVELPSASDPTTAEVQLHLAALRGMME